MLDFANALERVSSDACRVVVVGQGYVGLSVAAGAAAAGMIVVGVDADADRVQSLSAGERTVAGVDESLLSAGLHSGRLTFSGDVSEARDAAVVLICVPTPVREHRPDLSYVESAGSSLAAHVRPGTLVILESTTYPGTTEDVLRPLLETGGLSAGRDFALAYSPERIDPGNPTYALRNVPRVVGGIDDDSTRLAAAFYSRVVDEVVPVSTCRSAEMAKLLENTFRMVNIALVNELATLCSEQQIDVWEVIHAAASKPFGFLPFYPGPGVGGHCIPLDPTYLSWQSHRDTGRRFRLIELAQDINADMPRYVARRISDALNDRGISTNGARVHILGVTYKPNVGDIRESAAVEVMSLLARRGVKLSYSDPYVARLDEHGLDLTSSSPDPDVLSGMDCVALLTPHRGFYLDEIRQSAALVFDARNAMGVRGDVNVVTL